tara:strand:- start:46 stop:483 length:438 start_codon:yes stop_codon:yes gene_type:complete
MPKGRIHWRSLHDLIYSRRNKRAYSSIVQTFVKINRQEDPPNVGKGKYYINPTFTKVDRNAQRKKKNKKENERVFKRRATSIKPAQAKGARAAVTAMAQTSSQVVNENQLSHESSCAETSSLVSSCMSSSEDPNSPINSSPKNKT